MLEGHLAETRIGWLLGNEQSPELSVATMVIKFIHYQPILAIFLLKCYKWFGFAYANHLFQT